MTIEVRALHVDVEITEADDLGELVVAAAPSLRAGDVVVVTHKAVSKNEGRVVDLGSVAPSPRAIAMAAGHSDARLVEVILRESRSVLRQRGPLIVSETHHGLVCANAGVDRSNAPHADAVVLLPRDPDASALKLRTRLAELTGVDVGVVVADTMGRAWREGIVGTAIGVSGIAPLRTLIGAVDPSGYALSSTVVAVADELAAAADLVLGKLERVPFALVRGFTGGGDGHGRDLIRDRARDLFR